jgi:hypothetical protein
MDSSENQNYDFLLWPGNFIKPEDGPGVRQGKNLMLSARGRMLRCVLIGAVIAVVGAVLGVVICTGIDVLMARPHA